jgi:hypothetical protein
VVLPKNKKNKNIMRDGFELDLFRVGGYRR